MTPLLAALAAALVLGGILAIIYGVLRHPAPAPRPPRTKPRRRPKLSRKRRIAVAAAAAAGVIVWTLTGWWIAIGLLPALVILGPTLWVKSTAAADIKRLEAIEDWSRHLAARLGVGNMLQNAVIGSLATVKEPIEAEVTRLVARLRAQWPLERALDAFGDDLNDAVGDQLVASLKLAAADNTAAGLKAVVADIADAIAVAVSNRRAVDTELAKVRQTARLVTIITVLAVVCLSAAGFLAPYGTPLGQPTLCLLAAAYLGCLIWIRRTSEPPAPPRLLTPTRPTEAHA